MSAEDDLAVARAFDVPSALVGLPDDGRRPDPEDDDDDVETRRDRPRDAAAIEVARSMVGHTIVLAEWVLERPGDGGPYEWLRLVLDDGREIDVEGWGHDYWGTYVSVRGQGEPEVARSPTCEVCSGVGQLVGPGNVFRPCEACGGTG